MCLALYFMAMHCRDCNALQQYCLSLTHTQWQCKSSVCSTKQAQLIVGWVGEPDKPNPANPQKLILGRSAWSARSAKSTVASSGQHLFNLRILQLLELVNFGWNQGCSVALEAMHILFAGLES